MYFLEKPPPLTAAGNVDDTGLPHVPHWIGGPAQQSAEVKSVSRHVAQDFVRLVELV